MVIQPTRTASSPPTTSNTRARRSSRRHPDFHNERAAHKVMGNMDKRQQMG